MTKRLQDMTLEELWELFPIELVEHNPEWRQWARQEIEGLECSLSQFQPIINHIGSTAIPRILAKPIIDILVEMPSEVLWAEIKDLMEAEGYICMSQSALRISFNKGYTPRGYADRVFHIHFHRRGDNDEILFRDYLLAHPSMAKSYEKLKISLLPAYRHDRDGYTAAKTDFVKGVISAYRR